MRGHNWSVKDVPAHFLNVVRVAKDVPVMQTILVMALCYVMMEYAHHLLVVRVA
jgi:hypothetical protein